MTGHYDLHAIGSAIGNEIWGDAAMRVPIYRPDITSEAQADATRDLPLVYVWSEQVVDGMLRGYSLSVNKSVVAGLLARHLPRAHPQFSVLRDAIAQSIRDAQVELVGRVCAQMQQRPSQVFAGR